MMRTAKSASPQAHARRSERRAAAKLAPPPASAIAPQLATLVEAPPSGAGWVYETKYDGYRILARIAGERVQLLTRRGGDFSARAPSVVQALAQLDVQSAVLDGELVSPPRAGRGAGHRAGDFQALQNALRDGRSQQLVYYAFDVLFLNGEDLRPLPLSERKQRLEALLSARRGPHLKLSEHLAGDGAQILRKACELGMEGVIAKRGDARYLPGRNKLWLKLKCSGRQEFVVVGFTPPSGSRRYLGALLLATRDGQQLRYAGKVGTGFSQSSLEELAARLKRLRRATPPLEPAPRGAEVRAAQWVEPELVAEIRFSEFTADGRLRHPSFQGLREDKPAREVARERPLD